MEHLQKSIITLRKENAERKTEIMSCLEDLVEENAPDRKKIENKVQMLKLFEYEKKLHEKLTEIQFDLHKFILLNENFPLPQEQVAIPDPNIPILISNTTKLLTELKQFSSHNNTQITANSTELRAQSWDLLENLSSTLQAPKKVENSKTHKDNSGHRPEIHKTLPQTSRSCSLDTTDIEPNSSDNSCEHFSKLDEICRDVSGKRETTVDLKEQLQEKIIQTTTKFVVDESTSETEGSSWELETQLDSEPNSQKDLILTKLNNGEEIKEEFVSSETESSIFNDRVPKDVHVNIFGVPTSVLKSEHNKNFSRVQNNLVDDFDMLGIEDETTPQSPIKDCNLSANFTAEEKIKKLGVMDRREAFEKTRTVAPVPDIRLQPTQPNPSQYVINDAKIPKLNVKCKVSYAESPSEFFIHLDNRETELLDALNDEITSHFKKTKTPYRTKLEAFESLGNFCCAYVKSDKIYYRAQVDNWLFDKQDSKLVLVQLVDYGYKILVHFRNLRMLNKQFATLPKAAIKCYLPLLYPPGSSKSNLLQNWPPASIEEFKELSGSNATIKPVYRIAFFENKGDKTAVDLFVEDQKHSVTIGQLLVDLGHAVQIILPEDDPMGIISDEDDIQKLEECNNINEVILGYDPKDEGRVCKFTRKDGTCFKGNNCNLEHVELPQGGYTNDKILTFVGALNRIVSPREGDHVHIRFTVFIDAAHYYINFTKFVDSLTHLENVINDKCNISTLKPYRLTPAFGEIVLVEHWTKRWLRAKIKHHLYNQDGHCTEVQVFMVDYGDIIDVPLSKIRHIKPEYLEVAFQAIECVLYNYKMHNATDIRMADKFFYENMYNRNFIARVMAVPDTLCIRVFHKNYDLGEILCNKGFLTRIKRQVPSEKALVIPSG